MKTAALTLLSAALLLAACDGTSEVNGGKPPVRFRHDATLKVTYATDVQAACHKAGLREIAGTVVNACAILTGPDPRVILPNPCAASGAHARAACHELGHANGWPADHGK